MTISTTNPNAARDLRLRALELAGAAPRLSRARIEDDSQDVLSLLAESALEHGIASQAFEAPIATAVRSVSQERPLATVNGAGDLLLVVDRRGRRICVEQESGRVWLTMPELLAELGAQHVGDEHQFLTLHTARDSSVPLHSLASPWDNAIALLRTERESLGAIIVYAVGVGALSLALPLAVQTLVNTVAFGQLLQPILVITLLLAAGLVFAAVLRAIQAWVVEVVQRRLFVKLVSALADRLPRVQPEAFETGNGPELINRFFDVFLAQKAVASLLLGGIEGVLTVTVGLVVLAFYHPLLLGFGALLIVLSAVVFVALGRGATSTTVKESKAKYAVAGWLEEMVRHPFFLKIGGASYATSRLDELAVDWLKHREAHFRIYYRQFVGALAVQVVAHAALLGLGGFLVVERSLTVGQLVAAELIVAAVVASLSKLGSKLESVYDLVAAADKLGALLGVPLEERGGDDTLEEIGPAEIELREVSALGGEFIELDLTIPKGELFAVRADRRTSAALVDLLFGLRVADRGQLLVDGHDIRDVRLADLRTRVAVVRDPETLPGTIADNVRATRRDSTFSELTEALEQAGLAKRLRSLPEGVRTQLTPSGAPLDRLGALRLTLARALNARPGLLVLDGVVDALPEDERVALLEAVREGRTVVVLTHELAIAQSCDRWMELGNTQEGLL